MGRYIVLLGLVGIILGGSCLACGYDADVHYPLVYYLARKIGFTQRQANEIASGSLAVDTDTNTEPLQVGKTLTPLDRGGSDIRARLHAFLDTYFYNQVYEAQIGAGKSKVEADKIATQAAPDARDKQQALLWKQAVTTGNCGEYIHFYQDIYSHGAYWSKWGHPHMGHSPDFLSYDQPAAKEMVRGVLAELARYMTLCFPREPLQVDMKRVDALLQRLIEVSPYNSARNEYFSFNLNGQGQPDLEAAMEEVGKALGEPVPPWINYNFDEDGQPRSAIWKVNGSSVPTGALRIKLVDDRSGEPLDGAKVEVTFQGSDDVQRAGAGKNGILDVATLPGGQAKFNARATLKGFAPGSVDFETAGEPPCVVVIRLQPGEAEKPPQPGGDINWALLGKSWVVKPKMPLVNPKNAPLRREARGMVSTATMAAGSLTRTNYLASNPDQPCTFAWTVKAPPAMIETSTPFQVVLTADIKVQNNPDLASSRGDATVTSETTGRIPSTAEHVPLLPTPTSSCWVYSNADESRNHDSVTYTGKITPGTNPGKTITVSVVVDGWEWLRWEYVDKYLNELQPVGPAVPKTSTSPAAPSAAAAYASVAPRPIPPKKTGAKPPYASQKIKVISCPEAAQGRIDTLDFTDLKPGMELPADHVITIRNPSAVLTTVLQLPSGAVVTIGKGAEAQLDPDGGATLLSGGAHIDTGQVRDGSKIELRTRNSVITDRGTIFSVNYDPKTKQTTVKVEEGSVTMTPTIAGKPPVTVGPGQQAQIEGDATAGPSLRRPEGAGSGGTTPPAAVTAKPTAPGGAKLKAPVMGGPKVVLKQPQPQVEVSDADRRKAEEHAQKADQLAQDGKWAQAEPEYREAVRLDPSREDLWWMLGDACVQQGKWLQAEKAYREGLLRMPDLGPLHSQLAWALLKQGHRDEALLEAKEAKRLGEKHHPVFKELGLEK